jgi:glycosyltransferase involved in cell wall biosynthesis
MPQYKISIIIPVYNVEEYISEAMESLLRQTIGFENLQIIFADDCSTDKSGSIIDEYAALYPNVTAIRLAENSGAAGIPRNAAMRIATAQYIMFLDPDDYYADDACSCLYEKIENNTYDLIAGYYSEIKNDGSLINEKAKNYEQFEERSFSIEHQYEIVLRMQNAFWSKIYKRSIILDNNISFPIKIPGQDTVFLCRYLLCCENIYYINKKIVFYRLREKNNLSISNQCSLEFFDGIQTCYKMIFDIMVENKKPEYIPNVLESTIDFYFVKLLDSDLITAEETKVMLYQWKWVFNYYRKAHIKCKSPFTRIVFATVINSDIDHAVQVLTELKHIRKDILNLVEGKNWLADQYERQKEAISELQNWSKAQDKTITELRDWSTKLEEAKNYHVKRSENIEELLYNAQKNTEANVQANKELEDNIAMLMNKNKKLTFYLKEEINKPWYKKLIKHNKEDYIL